LAVAHSYQQQGKSVLLLKPELDTRFGAEMIQSKAGLQQKADVLIKKNTDLLREISASQRNVKCILVDEVHLPHECRS
jgi:thymidine kinase